MDSSDLFSHRQAPEVAVSGANSKEPVQAPVFSDQHKPHKTHKTHTADSPSP